VILQQVLREGREIPADPVPIGGCEHTLS
jgi:hypothetical protein